MRPLIAYNSALNVVATLDYAVIRDDDGRVIDLLDFEAIEASGGKLRAVWQVDNATGSGTWPEFLGGQAHNFRVELTGQKITALIHQVSGYRRDRATIEAAIAAVEATPSPIGGGLAQDIRHLVGGPNHPLPLDDQGRTALGSVSGTPPQLRGFGLARPRS